MNIHTWPDYIIRKGLLLSSALLCSALILSVWSDAVPSAFPLLRRYTSCFVTSSAMVAATALLGGLLLEDMLRRQGL